MGGVPPQGTGSPPARRRAAGRPTRCTIVRRFPPAPRDRGAFVRRHRKKKLKYNTWGGTAPAPQERAWLPAKGWGELGWIRPAIGPCCRTADPCSLGHIQGDKAQAGRFGCGRFGAGSVRPARPVRAGPVVRLQNGSHRLSGWGHRAVTPPREGTGPQKGSKTPGCPNTAMLHPQYPQQHP